MPFLKLSKREVDPDLPVTIFVSSCVYSFSAPSYVCLNHVVNLQYMLQD